jgi:hypothetical protein
MNSILQAMLKNPVILDILNSNIDEGYFDTCSKPNLSNNEQDSKKAGVNSGVVTSGLSNCNIGSNNNNHINNLVRMQGTFEMNANTLTNKSKRFAGCIACEVKDLVFPGYFGRGNLSDRAGALRSTVATLVPSDLLYSIWLNNRYLSGYDQQDAHEFLVALRDSFDTHWMDYHVAVRNNGNLTNTNAAGGVSGGGARALELGKNAATEMDSNEGIVAETVGIGNELANQYSVNRFTSTNSNTGASSSSQSLSSSSSSTTNSSPLPPNAPMSAFSQAFSGILRSEIHCLRCSNISLKDELFYDVSLSMDALSNVTNSSDSKSGQLNKSDVTAYDKR